VDQHTIIFSKLMEHMQSSTYMRNTSLMKKLKAKTHKKCRLR